MIHDQRQNLAAVLPDKFPRQQAQSRTVSPAGNGDGSALMKNPALAGRIVAAVSGAINAPTTVKIRTGWDESSLNAPHLAEICAANGAAAICVHGRTRSQLYRPPIDFETIKKVKKAVTIPEIAKGGI